MWPHSVRHKLTNPSAEQVGRPRAQHIGPQVSQLVRNARQARRRLARLVPWRHHAAIHEDVRAEHAHHRHDFFKRHRVSSFGAHRTTVNQQNAPRTANPLFWRP